MSASALRATSRIRLNRRQEALMVARTPSDPTAGIVVGPDTMIYEGRAISLASEVGALTLLHGALQSAIASVDDAREIEQAYKSALPGLSTSA